LTDLTPLEAIVIAALSDRARYGYELVERIAELTEGRMRVRPGNLYRVLERLGARGLVAETRDAAGEREDERRRYFRATARGVRAAGEELSFYGRVLGRAPGLRERAADG
jgi:DNA-binding PadR family transcriptional regulator